MKIFRKCLFVTLGLMLLAGCSPSSPNFLSNPASPIARDEGNLYAFLLVLSAIVFILVEGLLIYVLIKFRKKPQHQDEPAQQYRQMLIEAIYTGIPLLTVAGIFVLMVFTMQGVAAPADAAGNIHVKVVAHRWWWEFDYPDENIVTATELHIPVNTPVMLTMESVDVIHSFYVPQLAGKTDVIPGITNHMWLEGDTIGVYHGQCAEFCGLNHANMRFKVYVDSPDDYQKWVTNQQQPFEQPQGDVQQKGYDTIVNGICSSCHKLGSHGPDNPIGPDLTHLFSRSTFAGGTFDLNEENLRRWLEDTQAMKPGNDMIVHLSSDQIDALVSYLTKLH